MFVLMEAVIMGGRGEMKMPHKNEKCFFNVVLLLLNTQMWLMINNGVMVLNLHSTSRAH